MSDVPVPIYEPIELGGTVKINSPIWVLFFQKLLAAVTVVQTDVSALSNGIPASSVVTETAYGQSSAVGTGTDYARDDHTHGTPATTKDKTAITGLLKGDGTSVSAASAPTDYVATGDSRLSDARTPTAHNQAASTITDFNTAALAAAPAETVITIGNLIDSATAKTTPVDADMIGLMDSAAANILKKLSWANIKATLKTYFDTLYPNIKEIIQLTAKVAAIGTTAITGTNTTGLYRIAYYLEDTTADITAGTIMVTFAYTDDAGATTVSSVALPLTALGRTSGDLFIRVLGTGSISYSTTLVGIIGTSQYALFITGEKLL